MSNVSFANENTGRGPRVSESPDVYERIDALVRAAGTNKVSISGAPCFAINRIRGGRRWWWNRVMRSHAQAKRIRAARGGKVDVLLIGDSITHNWENVGGSFYEELCEGREVMNVAIGGDDIDRQSWIVRNGLLDGMSAKLVMIMLGTNERPGDDSVAVRLKSLVDFVHGKMPDATVLVCGILPRLRESEAVARKGNGKTNQQIRDFCDGKKTVFLDVGGPMREALSWPEKERKKIAVDYLHPNFCVYGHWLSLMKPYLPAPEGDVAPKRHIPVMKIGRSREKGNYASDELNRKMSATIAANPNITHIYLRYRTSVAYLDGKLQTKTADDTYHSSIGFVPDGQEHDAVIPIEGWSRSGVAYVPSEKMRFVFALGAGAIDLVEVGIVAAPTGTP